MLKNYIKELVNLSGVSSREDDVIRYIFPKFKEYSEDVHVDKLGNVILKIPSKKKNAKKIMIFAHMDEIGFIVRKVELDGFLRVERIGGVSTQILPGFVIDLLGKKGVVKGIIGTPAHHFINLMKKYFRWELMLEHLEFLSPDIWRCQIGSCVERLWMTGQHWL